MDIAILKTIPIAMEGKNKRDDDERRGDHRMLWWSITAESPGEKERQKEGKEPIDGLNIERQREERKKNIQTRTGCCRCQVI